MTKMSRSSRTLQRGQEGGVLGVINGLMQQGSSFTKFLFVEKYTNGDYFIMQFESPKLIILVLFKY